MPSIDLAAAAPTRRGASSLAVKAALALVMLSVLYYLADWHQVAQTLRHVDPVYLVAALAMFVPQTLVSAQRWRRLLPASVALPLVDSLRHTLAASSVNLVAPMKLGDFSKAMLLPWGAGLGRVAASSLVIVEKLADVAALLTFVAAGWWTNRPGLTPWLLLSMLAIVVLARRAGDTGSRFLVAMPGRGWYLNLVGWSLLLWGLHVSQIDLFCRAAGVTTSPAVSCQRLPLALFAGLVPLGLWGVGTRDAALIWLYSDIAPPASMVVVGLLTTTRYLVPGLCGLPLLTTLGDKNLRRPFEPRESKLTIDVQSRPAAHGDTDIADRAE